MTFDAIKCPLRRRRNRQRERMKLTIEKTPNRVKKQKERKKEGWMANVEVDRWTKEWNDFAQNWSDFFRLWKEFARVILSAASSSTLSATLPT